MTVQTSGVIPALTRGQRLTVAMEYAGYKTETMALQMRCSATTIRNYITGRTRIDYPALKAWADITGVDLGWLETGQAGPTDGPGLTSVAGTGFEPVTSGSLGAEVIPLRTARTAPRGVPERPAAVEGERTAA